MMGRGKCNSEESVKKTATLGFEYRQAEIIHAEGLLRVITIHVQGPGLNQDCSAGRVCDASLVNFSQNCFKTEDRTAAALINGLIFAR